MTSTQDTTARAATDAPDGAAADRDIVCACAQLTHGALRRTAGMSAGSFEDFLKTKGANGVVIGERCTACLLDLEHLFTSTHAEGARPIGPDFGEANRDEGPSLKHRIYAVIDRLSPPVPAQLIDTATILAGEGVRQSLVIANDSLLFERETNAPAVRVDLRIRDEEGRLRHSARHMIAAGDALDVDVSRHLSPAPGIPLAIGTLEITRRFAHPGYRGTTRPQILVETDCSSSAVHTQGPQAPGERWASYYYRPDAQRFFFALSNHTRRAMIFLVSYPLGLDDGPRVEPIHDRIVVPPKGARLAEVTLPAELGNRVANRRVTVRCKSDDPGGRKISLVMASRDLSRLSIDHPS